MNKTNLISAAVTSLILLGFTSVCLAQEDDGEEELQQRPNPMERNAPSGAPASFGAKARDLNPVDPVASPGFKMHEIDPSGPVVSPGDKFQPIDPIGPVTTRKGKAPLLNQPDFTNPAGKVGFNPQPEPPARIYHLQDGRKLQIMRTSRGNQAYVLQGGKRIPARDGVYRVKGGKDVSVKMGIAIEDRSPSGAIGKAGKGREKMGLVIEDKKPRVAAPTAAVKGPGRDGREKMGIVMEEKPPKVQTPAAAVKSPVSSGTEKMGIVVEDKKPKKSLKMAPTIAPGG